MQKSGMTKADQTIEIVRKENHICWECLTNRDPVGEDTQGTEVEATLLDLLAPVYDRSYDGYNITQGQCNDTHTGESIESCRRAKVDESEQDLDGHAEHHSVERHVELGVDLAPPVIDSRQKLARALL